MCMLLKEFINRKINRRIDEELSISKEVERTSRDIYNTILNYGFPKDEEYLSFKVNDISVTCICHKYNNRNDYEKDVHQEEAYSISRHGIKMMTLHLYYVSGGLLKGDLYDSIYHETEHLFQQDMMPSPNNKEERKKSEKYNEFYKLVRIILNNGYSIEERKVAAGMYFAFSLELNGYLNGLYGYLIENEPPLAEVNSIVKKSPLYKMIMLSEEAIVLLNNPNGEKYVTPYKEYGFTKERMIKRIRSALKIAYNKLGKIIVKYKQDFLMESTAHNIYLPIHYLFE